MELSLLDFRVLTQELQSVVQAKISKIYEPAPGELLFQLHSTSAGKQLLRLIPGVAVLLAEEKAQTPLSPSAYCIRIRKLLEGLVIKSVQQVGGERIIAIAGTVRGENRTLYLELFGKGNCVITDAAGIILLTMRIMEMRDRTVKAKQQYQLPPARPVIAELEQQEFSKLFQGETQLVRQLATAGLGGLIAEELCARVGIDRKVACSTLTDTQRTQLWNTLRQLFSEPSNPCIVRKDGIPIIALPFSFRGYPQAEPMPSMSAAIAAVIDTATEANRVKQQTTTREKTKTRLESIIRIQGEQIAQLEQQATAEQRKGELIYEQYQELKELLTELQQAFRERRLPEEAKRHARVRSIDLKSGTVTIE